MIETQKTSSKEPKCDPLVLVVLDEVLQLVGVHHDVKPTHLSQSELAVVHTGEAHLHNWICELKNMCAFVFVPTSFHVLVLLAFLAPSTAPWYSLRCTRVIASLAKLEMLLYNSLAASYMPASKHLKKEHGEGWNLGRVG